MTDTTAIATAGITLADFIAERVNETGRLFASEAERAQLFHGGVKAAARRWRKPAPCMYQGCLRRSIAASHTLQRAGPIAALIENGHVLTPRSEQGVLSMKLVGASEASTFAGFCGEHERLFAGFESRKEILTEEDAGLQIFRTLCREIRRKTHDLDQLEPLVTNLLGRLDAEVATEAQRLGVTSPNYTFEGTPLDEARTYLVGSRQVLADLNALYAAHWPAIDGSGPSALEGAACQTDMAFPVALSGLSTFVFQGAPFTCVLGVIPQAQGTLFYMAGGPGAQAAIDAALRNHHLDLPLIDLIERWMIRGTDHWFLRPSVWSAIPTERQQALLNLISDRSGGLGDAVPLSIFDDLRRTALAVPSPAPLTGNLATYIAGQGAKLR